MIDGPSYKGSPAMASSPPRPNRSRLFNSLSYIVNIDPVIVVRRRPGAVSQGILTLRGQRYPCAIGKGGVTARKREGDGATPRGRFLLRRIWVRPEWGLMGRAGLPMRRTRPQDGWCDDMRHPRYNRPVVLPFAASCERMWRDDRVYDVVVEIGWNDAPAIRGRGSAIFLHLARPGHTPTEGCVAVSRRDMSRILPHLTSRTRIDIA
jgi:L,D-peptidoglycan transpeptidase YkuD (ErfK/YbiS/YcfS/YnhG family)